MDFTLHIALESSITFVIIELHLSDQFNKYQISDIRYMVHIDQAVVHFVYLV